MAQPSVVQYFNTRKRAAIDDPLFTKSRKVLVLDKKSVPICEPSVICLQENSKIKEADKCNLKANIENQRATIKAKHSKIVSHQQSIDKFVNSKVTKISTEKEITPKNLNNEEKEIKAVAENITAENDKTKNLEHSKKPVELNLKGIQQKLTRSAKLAELKASLSRYKHNEAKLQQLETKTQLKTLKSFKSIELEVHLSPQKIQSPEKCYLSPKKDATIRKNLFSPKKETSKAHRSLQDELSQSSLRLPYKYRYIAEIFRAIETICQLMYNRKEIITFKKLKQGVEEMLKRSLYEKHLSQIMSVYPEAYLLKVEKVKTYGSIVQKEQWELVIIPKVSDQMTSEVLLERRRYLYNALIDKLKVYHNEFLKSLNPPLDIPKDKIQRWHPEFDLEKVPDIQLTELPKPPTDDKIVSGKEVLEKAKLLLGVNKRFDLALEKLKEKEAVPQEEKTPEGNSVLKGIPKALLEKIRQRQAVKALESITRSTNEDKKQEMYSRLPEVLRLTRNLYVSEKKSVLSLDTVLEKLGNSFSRTFKKPDIEAHLKLISTEFPDLLIFHNIRNTVYLKLSKTTDINSILNIIESKQKEKCLFT